MRHARQLVSDDVSAATANFGNALVSCREFSAQTLDLTCHNRRKLLKGIAGFGQLVLSCSELLI